MELERLTFSDGSWVDLKKVMTRGMRKQIDLAAQKAMPYDKAQAAGVNLENPEELKAFVLKQPEYLASQNVGDAMLLVGVVATSWGDPVTIDLMDSIPDEFAQRILDRLTELWYETRKKEADFFVPRSEPIKTAANSQPN